MIRVKATREGLVGDSTSSGYLIDLSVPFIALPSTKALRRFVRLRNPVNGLTCFAVVLDVGPWNEHDDDYVFNNKRPAAEIKPHDQFGRKTNGAGIDLGEVVWHQLRMKGNTEVEWEFL